MIYAIPKMQQLSVTNDTKTYTKNVYAPFTTLSGVTDEAYNNYDNSATYNTGDYVIVPEMKSIYRCSADNVSGVFPLSDESKWTYYGLINSYRMLADDEGIGAFTTGTNVSFTMDFSRKDTFALISIEFTTLTVTQYDGNTDEIVKTITIQGLDIGAFDFATYFYGTASTVTRVINSEMEWLPNSYITFTFKGDVSIGTLCIGLSESLGITLVGTSLDFEDKSKIKIDANFGTREVVRFGHIRVLKANILFDKEEYSLTAQKISRIIGKTVLFIPTVNDTYLEMSNLAYMEKFSLPADGFTKTATTTTLIGVAT